MRAIAALLVVTMAAPACAAAAGLAAQCRAVGDDDTIRPYDPSLRTKLLEAYKHQFSQARMPPDQKQFEAETNIRCMDGRLFACFTGANLPCNKLNVSRDNPGADAYCKTDPNARFVPAFAAGHDSAYDYRCVAGKPEITGRTFPELDRRGFAKSLWTPLD